jgi:hypothetical protein
MADARRRNEGENIAILKDEWMQPLSLVVALTKT